MNGENHVLTLAAAMMAKGKNGYYLERRRPGSRLWKRHRMNPETYGRGWRLWYSLPTPSDKQCTPWMNQQNEWYMRRVYGVK